MTHSLSDLHKERQEMFDRNFRYIFDGLSHELHKEDVKEFNTSSLKAYIECEIERIEGIDGMKIKSYENIGCTGKSVDGWCCATHRDITKVINEHLTYLREQLERLR